MRESAKANTLNKNIADSEVLIEVSQIVLKIYFVFVIGNYACYLVDSNAGVRGGHRYQVPVCAGDLVPARASQDEPMRHG